MAREGTLSLSTDVYIQNATQWNTHTTSFLFAHSSSPAPSNLCLTFSPQTFFLLTFFTFLWCMLTLFSYFFFLPPSFPFPCSSRLCLASFFLFFPCHSSFTPCFTPWCRLPANTSPSHTLVSFTPSLLPHPQLIHCSLCNHAPTLLILHSLFAFLHSQKNEANHPPGTHPLPLHSNGLGERNPS